LKGGPGRTTVLGRDFATNHDEILAQFVNNNPGIVFNPYIGDYQDLQAVGNTFFGVFSASNAANGTLAFFPEGVAFPRSFIGNPNQASFQLQDLVGGTVSFSIDPFFFSEAALLAVPEASSLTLFSMGVLGLFVYRWLRRSADA
jgi:hypothetical protein